MLIFQGVIFHINFQGCRFGGFQSLRAPPKTLLLSFSFLSAPAENFYIFPSNGDEHGISGWKVILVFGVPEEGCQRFSGKKYRIAVGNHTGNLMVFFVDVLGAHGRNWRNSTPRENSGFLTVEMVESPKRLHCIGLYIIIAYDTIQNYPFWESSI